MSNNFASRSVCSDVKGKPHWWPSQASAVARSTTLPPMIPGCCGDDLEPQRHISDDLSRVKLRRQWMNWMMELYGDTDLSSRIAASLFIVTVCIYVVWNSCTFWCRLPPNNSNRRNLEVKLGGCRVLVMDFNIVPSALFLVKFLWGKTTKDHWPYKGIMEVFLFLGHI